MTDLKRRPRTQRQSSQSGRQRATGHRYREKPRGHEGRGQGDASVEPANHQKLREGPRPSGEPTCRPRAPELRGRVRGSAARLVAACGGCLQLASRASSHHTPGTRRRVLIHPRGLHVSLHLPPLAAARASLRPPSPPQHRPPCPARTAAASSARPSMGPLDPMAAEPGPPTAPFGGRHSPPRPAPRQASAASAQ